jgi:hypothetical protein
LVDETYVKVAGRWPYLYRAVDQYGQVIDVLLSQQRDTAAARRFFIRALAHWPAPLEVTTDKAGPYLRVLVQSRVMNHRGYVPWLLWVRPTNVGERVWLLMRPGICVDDLDTRTSQIAAACWARDARVRCGGGWSPWCWLTWSVVTR